MMLGKLRAAWDRMSLVTRWWVITCVLVGWSAFALQLAEIPQLSALRGSDNSFNYFWLRSPMVGGDWDFRDDIETTNTLTPEYRAAALALPLTKTGLLPNKYGVGWALVSAPGYLIADGIVAAGRAYGGWKLERDGYNFVYQICLQTWHLFLAMGALALTYRVVRRWCSRENSLRGIAVMWAGSPLLYYQTCNLSMSHGVTFFALVVCVYGVVRTVEEPGKFAPWFWTGAGLGLAVITRFQTAIYGVIPLWAWLRYANEIRRARANSRVVGSVSESVGENVNEANAAAFAASSANEKNETSEAALAGALLEPVEPADAKKPATWLSFARATIAAALGAGPFIALQMFAWKIVFGSWLVYSYGTTDSGFNWTKPEFVDVLFSPYHGLFYWHPLLALGAACFAWMAMKQRGVMAACFVALLLTVYVNAAWWCWWFGAAFGGRAFEGCVLFFMISFAFALERLPRWVGGLLLWLSGFVVASNIVWLVLYRGAVIPRNAPVTYADVLGVLKRALHAVGIF